MRREYLQNWSLRCSFQSPETAFHGVQTVLINWRRECTLYKVCTKIYSWTQVQYIPGSTAPTPLTAEHSLPLWPLCNQPKSIEWFIEDQALSPSYDMAAPLSLSRCSRVSPVELTDGKEGKGWEELNHTSASFWSSINHPILAEINQSSVYITVACHALWVNVTKNSTSKHISIFSDCYVQ